MSKEKPILFSTPMVQAILEDKKTKTRRVAKIKFLEGFNPEWSGYKPVLENGKFFLEGSNHRSATTEVKQPYQVGDIIWVRETWKYYVKAVGKGESFRVKQFLAYKADEDNGNVQKSSEWFEGKWRPSIFMPRAAARLFLRVTNVRVERLQDIQLSDCLKEGIQLSPCEADDDVLYQSITAEDKFAELWDSLNTKRGYGWDVNPWVWVIEFERVPNES